MRKVWLLAVLSLVSCVSAPPPPPAPAAAPTPITPAQPTTHGFTLQEEAKLLEAEDRRELDPAMASAWLNNTNPLHRQRMALALGRIGPATFVDANRNGVKDAKEKQAGVELLARLISDPDRGVRETAAFSLGEIGDPAGLDALFQFAADTDAGVAAEATEAISKLAKDVPLARFTPLVNDAREGVKARAIRFLGRWTSDEAAALAASALDSTSTAIRQEAVYALSRRAYAPARAKLELLVTDPAPLIRAYAVNALGRIAAKESLPALLEATRDPYPWVRTNALVAIARLGAKDITTLVHDGGSRDAALIMALTEDPDPGTRASAIAPLGYYATKYPSARKKLQDISVNGSRVDRELAAGALARQFAESQPMLLLGLMDSGTPWMKVRMIEETAGLETGGRAMRRGLVFDPDPIVRAAALGAIPDDKANGEIDLIRRSLLDPDVVVRANAIDRLSKTNARDVNVYLEAEKREKTLTESGMQNDARLAAINAIAGLSDYPERESFLRGLLTDHDPVVRRIASDLIVEKLGAPRPQYTPLAIERPAGEYEQIVEWSRQPHTATIHMPRGKIELQLLTQDAPMTTWNFQELAHKKFFDNTSFMRVVPNFVIQGGDPRNDMNGGPGYALRDEINLQKYTRGAVGMALSGPDTGGSQFFITHSPQPHLDGGYTIFARVYSGMSGVVDQTERGDKVDTVTIDEHPVASADEVSKIQAMLLPTEIGPITPARLLAVVPEYPERKEDYKPDESLLEYMATSIKPDDHLEVYLGTWCDDSQREIPKLLKILDILRDKFHRELPTTYVAVDKSKEQPANLLAGKHVQKVATIIYYRGDQEVGRIEERPTGLIEDDLLALAGK
ncbi:MAG: HEAT repeat domain-containing protein [Acidobacteria bacterium]|nr:HEAT repeat domain-containing protein [Acidobacteriota bacterium]